MASSSQCVMLLSEQAFQRHVLSGWCTKQHTRTQRFATARGSNGCPQHLTGETVQGAGRGWNRVKWGDDEGREESGLGQVCGHSVFGALIPARGIDLPSRVDVCNYDAAHKCTSPVVFLLPSLTIPSTVHLRKNDFHYIFRFAGAESSDPARAFRHGGGKDRMQQSLRLLPPHLSQVHSPGCLPLPDPVQRCGAGEGASHFPSN